MSKKEELSAWPEKLRDPKIDFLRFSGSVLGGQLVDNSPVTDEQGSALEAPVRVFFPEALCKIFSLPARFQFGTGFHLSQLPFQGCYRLYRNRTLQYPGVFSFSEVSAFYCCTNYAPRGHSDFYIPPRLNSQIQTHRRRRVLRADGQDGIPEFNR
jgi:hypothetical protein